MMNRRTFFATALGVLAVPLAVESQQAGNVPRIGYLLGRSSTEAGGLATALRQGLHDLGYVEGRTILIEYRYAEGQLERLPDLAADLVRLKVDVIVTAGEAAIRAARWATSTIPIIMASSGDPVGSGLVASLARPGGNVTGLSLVATEAAGKRLELLKEALPKLSRVVVLWNPTNQSKVPEWENTQAAARALGLTLHSVEVRALDDFEGTFSAITRERPDALVISSDALTMIHRTRIADFAIKRKVPTMSENRAYADAGGLMSYGANQSDLFRRAALYVDKILKGAKPADLPIEQPTKFELVINLKTAKALGLTIPPSLLLRADQVIE